MLVIISTGVAVVAGGIGGALWFAGNGDDTQAADLRDTINEKTHGAADACKDPPSYVAAECVALTDAESSYLATSDEIETRISGAAR